MKVACPVWGWGRGAIPRPTPQIYEFTVSDQLVWEDVIPGKVYTATYRDEVLQLNYDPREGGFYVAMEEIKIGKVAISKLCWGISRQKNRRHGAKGIMKKLVSQLGEKCC